MGYLVNTSLDLGTDEESKSKISVSSIEIDERELHRERELEERQKQSVEGIPTNCYKITGNRLSNLKDSNTLHSEREKEFGEPNLDLERWNCCARMHLNLNMKLERERDFEEVGDGYVQEEGERTAGLRVIGSDSVGEVVNGLGGDEYDHGDDGNVQCRQTMDSWETDDDEDDDSDIESNGMFLMFSFVLNVIYILYSCLN